MTTKDLSNRSWSKEPNSAEPWSMDFQLSLEKQYRMTNTGAFKPIFWRPGKMIEWIKLHHWHSKVSRWIWQGQPGERVQVPGTSHNLLDDLSRMRPFDQKEETRQGVVVQLEALEAQPIDLYQVRQLRTKQVTAPPAPRGRLEPATISTLTQN